MNKNTNTWKKALSGICALTMVFGIAASPAYAMEDMTEPNMSITNHPNSMIPTKLVTPVGNKAFYKIDGGKVIYADRDDGTGWQAVPSAYIKGSEYNVGNVDYGAYFVGADEVVFVPLNECRAEDDGTYTYHHGTKDSATVSEDVDTATNADPSMGTNFYVHVENGIDPDGSTSEEVVPGKTDDGRVEYEVTIATKATYQLKATVPMYVCMYGYRGTGNIIAPDSDAYQLKNYSTSNSDASATIVDITKVTHYAKIYDENHSDDTLFSISYDSQAKKYTYWYSNPAFMSDGKTPNPDWQEPENYLVLTDKNINASGQCYAIFIDGKWDFKVAGVLEGDALKETVTAIDPNHPLSTDLHYGEWNFGTEFAVGDSQEGGKDTGLALKVSELQAEPATWRLVDTSTKAADMKRGELAMSLAPETAISNASAIDLSTASAPIDITERGWFLAAPQLGEDGTVSDEEATSLGVTAKAQMAGGNVNDSGCTSVVKVTYTMTPAFGIDDGESNTVVGDGVTSNR